MTEIGPRRKLHLMRPAQVPPSPTRHVLAVAPSSPVPHLSQSPGQTAATSTLPTYTPRHPPPCPRTRLDPNAISTPTPPEALRSSSSAHDDPPPADQGSTGSPSRGPSKRERCIWKSGGWRSIVAWWMLRNGWTKTTMRTRRRMSRGR